MVVSLIFCWRSLGETTLKKVIDIRSNRFFQSHKKCYSLHCMSSITADANIVNVWQQGVGLWSNGLIR